MRCLSQFLHHLHSFLFTADGAEGDEKRKSLQITEIPHNPALIDAQPSFILV